MDFDIWVGGLVVIGGHQCLILVGGSGWFVEVGAQGGGD